METEEGSAAEGPMDRRDDNKNQQQNRLAAIWGWCIHRLKPLPAILFMASLAVIAHHHDDKPYLYWLDALDSQAYLIVSGISALFDSSADDASNTVVVTIDQDTFEGNRYKERSPLDRCALSDDLKLIYEKIPDNSIVAIDLDLSPMIGETPKENGCQTGLEAQIVKAQKRKIETVLITPFITGSAHLEAQKQSLEWREKLHQKGVRFAGSDINQGYGLALRYRQFTREERIPVLGKIVNCLAKESIGSNYPNCDDIEPVKRHEQERKLIDGRRLKFAKERMVGVDCIRDKSCVQKYLHSQNRNIVFFGGVYGFDDRFLTSVGWLNGVQLHAAIFLSENMGGIDEYATLDWLFDVGFGILISPFIGWMWQKYFGWRTGTGAAQWRRQSAWVWPILMVALISFAAILVFSCSILLLSGYLQQFVVLRFLPDYLWISPLLISIGLLIHTFVMGPVDYVLEHSSDKTHELKNERAGGAWSSVTNFLWGEWISICRHSRGAAAWMFLRRFLWLLILLWALVGAIQHDLPQVPRLHNFSIS